MFASVIIFVIMSSVLLSSGARAFLLKNSYTMRSKLCMSSTAESSKVFAKYSIYKGKGAVSIKGIPPSLNKLESNAKVVSREGALLLEFAPIGNAAREYDWSKKITFALAPTECGSFLAMSKATGVEFFHDPNMGGAAAGTVTKKLKCSVAPDGGGMFMMVQVNDKSKSGTASINLPVSWGEIEVIKTLMQFSIPRMLAFDGTWSSDDSSVDREIPMF